MYPAAAPLEGLEEAVLDLTDDTAAEVLEEAAATATEAALEGVVVSALIWARTAALNLPDMWSILCVSGGLARWEKFCSLELGRVGLVVVLRVRGVLQGGRLESDKVVRTSLADGRVDRGADLRGLRDVDAGAEVLEERLLVDRSSVEVDRARSNVSDRGGVSVVGLNVSMLGR